MKQRVLIPEQMDDPGIAEEEHIRALRGLRRINWWTGNARAVWPPVREVTQKVSERTSLLDIATGSADVPAAIHRYAANEDANLAIDACDASPTALSVAKSWLPPEINVELYPLDVVAEPIPKRYDVVMCTTFLHHLSSEDVTTVLQKMRQAARKRVVIVDLERGYLNWVLVWLACRLWSRSPVVHFDGPQSVRAAFTLDEMKQLATDAGFSHFRVRRYWPCRFVFVGDV